VESIQVQQWNKESGMRKAALTLAVGCISLLFVMPSAFADLDPAASARGGPSIGPVPPGQTVDELVRRGLRHSENGDLDAADTAWEELRALHPHDPAGHVYAIDTLYWRRSLDFTDSRFDAPIRKHANRGIELAERRLKSSPNDALSHFYCGQALSALMRLEGFQGSLYKAGKAGVKSSEYFERALEIDPELYDAKFGLGSYYYYASIAGRYLRWLSWLWFVPTGERDLGLEYITEAVTRGDYQRFEAATSLARIYLYMEEDPKRAAPLVEGLADDYPANTYLQFERLELRMILRDYVGTVEAARTLEESASAQYGAEERKQAARVWRARAELHLGQIEQASLTLTPLESGLEDRSRWNKRWILLTRGHLHDLAGRRQQAVTLYERVIKLKSRWGGTRPIELAELGLEQPFSLGQPEVQ
jgi:tetratricopeptide (TPR) repeat protein